MPLVPRVNTPRFPQPPAVPLTPPEGGEQEKLENVKPPFVMVVVEVIGAAYAPVADRMAATLASRSFLIDLTSNVWTAELVRVPTTACPASLQVQVVLTKHDSCQLDQPQLFLANSAVWQRP